MAALAANDERQVWMGEYRPIRARREGRSAIGKSRRIKARSYRLNGVAVMIPKATVDAPVGIRRSKIACADGRVSGADAIFEADFHPRSFGFAAALGA